jgi:hypothetical protein
MSTSNADHYARRAKSESDSKAAIEYLIKAVNELVSAVQILESKASRLRQPG